MLSYTQCVNLTREEMGNTMKLIQKILPVALIAALGACGGGGNGGAEDATGSARIQFQPQSNSFEAVEATENYRISGTAKTLSGAVDRTKTGWNVASTSQILANEITLTNADCANAAIQGINNGNNFRQEETITCDVIVKLPVLNNRQSRKLVLTYGVADSSGNIASRNFTVDVMPAAGRDPLLPQVSLVGTVSGGNASSSSAISALGGTNVTLSTEATSQFFTIEDMSYSQVAGPTLTINNSDCAQKTTINQKATCNAFVTIPPGTTTAEYIIQARATDTQGNTNAKTYTINRSTAGNANLSASLSRSTNFANPLFLAANNGISLSCFPESGFGEKTVRWAVIPLNSSGAVTAGQNVVISSPTNETITITAPSNFDNLTYAALCTVTDENGAKSPSATPDYTTDSGKSNANTFFFKVSDPTPAVALSLIGDPVVNAFVGRTVNLTMLAQNANGQNSSPDDFNYQWTIASPSGSTASFNGTQANRVASFTSNQAGTFVIDGCANRKSSISVLSTTCSGVQERVSATVNFTTASIIADANFDTTGASFQVAGGTFGVNAQGSSTSDGSAIRYNWASNDPEVTITNETSRNALVTISNSVVDGKTLSVTLTVSNTPSNGAAAVTASKTLSFRATSQPSGQPAAIDVSAGPSRTVPFGTWSSTSSFDLNGTSLVTNNEAGFTKAVRWSAIADLSAASVNCTENGSPIEVANLNPGVRNTEITNVFVPAAEQPAQGVNKSFFYVLRGELRASDNAVKSFDCSTVTVVLEGAPVEITATVLAPSLSQNGINGVSAYDFTVTSNTAQPASGPLRWFWYDANDSGNLNITNAQNESTNVTVTNGPNTVETAGLIVYTDSQLAANPTNFANASQRDAFVAKFPRQRTFVTLAVTQP